MSTQTTFPVVGGPDLTINGTRNGFVAKVSGASIPGPTLTNLLPSSADAGDPSFLLTVVGDDFVNGAVVRWDGSNKPTTYVSSSELDATIDAADLASGKTVAVTVRNPNGGISNALAFTISNPAPVLTSRSLSRRPREI